MQNKRQKTTPQILIIQKFGSKLNQIQLLHLNSNSRWLREHNHKTKLTEQIRILLSNPDSNTSLQIPSFYRVSRKSISKIPQTVLQTDHRQETFKKGFFGSNELKNWFPQLGYDSTQRPSEQLYVHLHTDILHSSLALGLHRALQCFVWWEYCV